MKSYAARRAALMAQMQAKGGGVAIIPTGDELIEPGALSEAIPLARMFA